MMKQNKMMKHMTNNLLILVVSIILLSSTLQGAVTPTLEEYPSPFAENGKYHRNTAFVVGRNAAPEDRMGMIQIVTGIHLETPACEENIVDREVIRAKEAIKVTKTGNILELNEPLGDVRATLTEIELDGLAGGIASTRRGKTGFNQYLRFKQSTPPSINSPKVKFAKNDAPISEVSDFLFIEEGTTPDKSFFEYELMFGEGLISEVENKKLKNFEGKEIKFFGDTYTMVSTNIDTDAKSITLELLGGTEYTLLEEGTTTQFSMDDKVYSVDVMIVENKIPSSVTLSVNGETVKKMGEGETRILQDGTIIGIGDIILNERGEKGLGDLVEFYLGATRIRLQDKNFGDSGSSTSPFGFFQGVKVNHNDIEDAWVQIRGELISSTEFKLSSIKYRLNADALPGHKNIYVPAKSSVREHLDEPEGMIGSFDILYNGLNDVSTSTITISPSGSDEYDLILESIQGRTYRFPFVTNERGTFKFGDAKNDFVFVEGSVSGTTTSEFTIGRNDYFVLNNKKAVDEGTVDTAISHVMRYTSIDTKNKQLHFEDLATGTKKVVYQDTNVVGALGKANLIAGGTTYVVYIADVSSGDEYPLAIDMNADAEIAGKEVRFVVNGGGLIDFTTGSASESVGVQASFDDSTNKWTITSDTGNGISAEKINPTLITVSKRFDSRAPKTLGTTTPTNEELTFTIEKKSENKIGISTNKNDWTSNGGFALARSEKDKKNYHGMTDYGAHISLVDAGGTQAQTLRIRYPLKQRQADVRVMIGETNVIADTETPDLCNVPELEPTYLFDDEVTNTADHHLILVGGPCINKLVEQIPGLTTCAQYREKYQSGDGIIQVTEHSGKAALLVAGYTAQDTIMVSKKLRKKEGLKGVLMKFTE